MNKELRFLVGLIFMFSFIYIFFPIVSQLALIYQYAVIVVSVVGFLILLASLR